MALIAGVGQAGATAPLSDVVQVAAGEWHTCALTTAGGVKCWGENGNGQLGDNSKTDRAAPVGVTGLESGVVAIAARSWYTCALTASGGVKCWGGNASGQLGDGSTTDRSVPVDVAGLTSGVVAIAAGGNHACAVTSGGGVKCWGMNASGQLGDNSTAWRPVPADVTGLASGVTAIAAGFQHTCAVVSGGGVKCWGDNADGQLGDSSTTDRLAPVDVVGLGSGVAAIATGGGIDIGSHTCALTAAGGLKCWGANGRGQLGDNSTAGRLVPGDVPGLAGGVVAVATGSQSTCALIASGGVRCWGGNDFGALGDGSTTQRPSPVDVAGLASGAVAIVAGGTHACAVVAGGRVKCWGGNASGQLGDGSAGERRAPTAVASLDTSTSAVATGDLHTCAVTSGGGAKCWGANHFGEVGDNSTATRLAPADVAGLATGVTAISAGVDYSCALTTGGEVKCWGRNRVGQLGDNSTTDRLAPVVLAGLTGVTAISAGSGHACALTAGGGVKCWGHNANGQVGDGSYTGRLAPVDVTGLGVGVVAVAAGDRHTCALTAAGGVKCWGGNDTGQLGDGSDASRPEPVGVTGLTSGVAAIAAGRLHTCALMAGGGVRCWGLGGATGDGYMWTRRTPTDVAGLAGVAAISAGSGHTCALALAGEVRCWGNNWGGQLGDGSTTHRTAPVKVKESPGGVVAISAGGGHTCALTATGGALCWGSNYYGQLGDGTAWYRSFPADVISQRVAPAVRGDAGGDGKADLFWRESGGGPGLSLWAMNGGAIAAMSHFAVGGEWQVADVGDLDGDGKADLVWRRAGDGATYLWTLNGSGIKGVANLGVVDPALWMLLGAADFDGDGRDDLAWRGADGTVYLWLMNGGAIVAQGSLGAVGWEWQVVDLADFNGDGRADILWQRTTDGEVYAWYMSGLSLLAQGSGGAVDRAAWALVAAADFNGDGRADILWRNPAGFVYLWEMQGMWLSGGAAIAPMDPAWTVRSVGDFDGDGRADILWRHADGAVQLWRMDGATRKIIESVTAPGGDWGIVAP